MGDLKSEIEKLGTVSDNWTLLKAILLEMVSVNHIDLSKKGKK